MQGREKIMAAIAAAKAKLAAQEAVAAQETPAPVPAPITRAVNLCWSHDMTLAASMHQVTEGDPGQVQLVRLMPEQPAPIMQVIHEQQEQQQEQQAQEPDYIEHADGTFTIHGKHYNSEQSQAIREVAINRKSLVLIGPAGSGKTTNIQGIAYAMIARGLPVLRESTKNLQAGSPGVLICSFTRRAVANIRSKMPAELRDNTLTIHKVLEFAPVVYEEWDPEQKKLVKKRIFEPQRNRHNPLPSSLKVIFVEETSMLGLDLFMKLWEALPAPEQVQWVFLGDINQLPPVFSKGIFGFKMIELPVIELKQIYRQALESPGLRLAHAIKDGTRIHSMLDSKHRFACPPDWRHPGKLSIRFWQYNITPELKEPDLALITAAKFFTTGVEQGYYDPMEDMILIPQNVKFGSIELGNYIADYLGRQRGAIVHEVIAGFQKFYLAVGDKILYDKEDAIIEEIVPNPAYAGAKYQEASEHMDRWGIVNAQGPHKPTITGADDDFEVDFSDIDALLNSTGDDDRVHAASHKIKIRYIGISVSEDSDADDSYEWLDKAAQVNKIISGYVMTIHKSQGCEWRRVFVVMHRSHNGMVSRELLYTACTRFREELVILAEPDIGKPGTRSFKPGSLARAIDYQQVPGNNLQEKLAYFRSEQLKALAQLQNEEDQTEQQRLLTILGDKIRAHINEQLAEWTPKVEAETAVIWQRLLAKHPDKWLPKYEVVLKTAIGDAAGMAMPKPGISTILLDSLYFLQNPEEAMQRTLPHEVCHIADACWFAGVSHGRTWKQLMTDLGFSPDKEIMHEMGSRAEGMKKVAAKLAK